MKSRIFIILAILTILLSSCSLASDITPPPNYQTPTVGPNNTAAALTEATNTAGTPQATIAPAGTPSAQVGMTGTPAGTPTVVIGSISGKIINGSSGAIPTGLNTTLHIFQHDTATQQFSEVSTKDTKVGADGTFKYDQIPLPANQAFYVSVNYANTEYQSDPVFPTAGQTNLDLPLSIYDTTTDASGLVADQAHILLDYSKPDVVQVVEFLIISNPGTKAIVPAQKGGPVVSIVLPKGYSNLQFEQGAIGDRYIQTSAGFADTTTIIPGTQKYQLVFAIDLPLPKPGLFGASKLDFSQPYPIKVNTLSVLAPQGVTITGTNFSTGGLQDMGSGVQYQVFNSTIIEAGQSLEVSASGQPKTSATASASSNSTQNILIGVGIFGVVLIIAGVWMYWRTRRNVATAQDEYVDGDEGGEKNEDNLDEIMDAIVALDDQFKAGNIQEPAYRARRAELKGKLKNS